jgi:RNA polymerase sigma-70 factor (ECF subfamily)
MNQGTPATQFLARWSSESRRRDEPSIALALDMTLQECAAAWPSLRVSAPEFAEHLAERADVALDPLEALTRLRVADVYLAFACLRGSDRAIENLRENYLVPLAAPLRVFAASVSHASELLEQFEAHLIGGPAPGLARYEGWGALGDWLLIAAVRFGAGRYPDLLPAREERLAEAIASSDPALVRLRGHAGIEAFATWMRAAVAEVTATLTSAERNLLGWHCGDEVSLRRLARLRGSGVGSLERELARLKSHVIGQLRAALCDRAGLSLEELLPAAPTFHRTFGESLPTAALRHRPLTELALEGTGDVEGNEAPHLERRAQE